jgi:hypothetical protein
MNLLRSRAHTLALLAVGLAACSDRSAITDPSAAPVAAPGGTTALLALVGAADPTAIPIGSPTRVQFFGRAAASNKSLSFPLSGSRPNQDQLLASARDWLATIKTENPNGPRDPGVRRGVEFTERLLAATTPAEIRAALGPERGRITSTRSARALGPAAVEHTASFRLDGRELLRVVTDARTSSAGPLAECVDDPYGVAIDPSQTCGYYDPYPAEAIASDLAAMQSQADILSAHVQATAARSLGLCLAEVWAYYAALGTFSIGAGETVFYLWGRDFPKAYTAAKVTGLGLFASYAAFQKYMACVKGSG